jgi:RNA polymerase sigma factor (TIGR02999 family)
MQAPHTTDVTGLLHACSTGNEQALGKLIELVYQDLRRAAHRYMLGERPGHTLQTTALIHEVYLRLLGVRRLGFRDRVHFLAMCARLMRRILVDFARTRGARKRGGSAARLSLDGALEISARMDPDLVSLDEAMKRLSEVDTRKSRVVEMRFFGGLSVEETAAALEVSPDTVMRDWKLAKSWLRREMNRKNRHAA